MRLDPNKPQPQAPAAKADQQNDPAFGNAKVDKLTDAMGAQGVAQDSTRVAALATRGAKAVKVADVLAGDKLAIGLAVNRTAQSVSQVAAHVNPNVARVAPPAFKGFGAVARVLGKWGPIVSIPFAGYDVAKAVTEHDPTAKRAAVANATLTVGGTAIGTAGALLLATPAGLPLLVGSAAVGALQLADTYLFKGKVMQALGDAGAKVWHLFKK